MRLWRYLIHETSVYFVPIQKLCTFHLGECPAKIPSLVLWGENWSLAGELRSQDYYWTYFCQMLYVIIVETKLKNSTSHRLRPHKHVSLSVFLLLLSKFQWVIEKFKWAQVFIMCLAGNLFGWRSIRKLTVTYKRNATHDSYVISSLFLNDGVEFCDYFYSIIQKAWTTIDTL